MYPIWLLECIVGGIFWVTVFILSIEKVFSRLWIPVMIANFLILFFMQSGMEMQNHGGINRTGFSITLIVLLIVYLLFKGVTKLWRYSFKLVALLILALALLTGFFYQFKISNSCQGWEQGLGGRVLLNDDNQCKTPIPTL